MNEEFKELLKEKANQVAYEHAKILENECQKVLDRFCIKSDDLIIEYHVNAEIKIKVLASHFKITNNFTYDHGQLTELNQTESGK